MTVRPPTCSVCGTPVERFDLEEDPFLERVRATAYCHGQVERVDISFAEMRTLETFAGLAFADQPRRLAP